MNASFELIEVGGFIASIEGMRFPTKSVGDSYEIGCEDEPLHRACCPLVLGPKDIKLACKLVKQGPVHAKFQRGITAWFRINMPRSVWAELDTYSVGVDMISSESTMYTLLKECKDITSDMFVDYTPDFIVNNFRENVDHLASVNGGRQNIPIEVLKACLPESWLQKRNRGFSYQCLSSMYHYRKDHRMPEWREVICPAIEALPYFKQLMLGEEE